MAKKIFCRKKITETALELAYEMGLEKLSMRKLAKRMGSSVMPIYDAFLSKEELIEEVYNLVVVGKEVEDTYFKRNLQILKNGIKYPQLFKDVQLRAKKYATSDSYYNNVIIMMQKESRLLGFSQDELKSLNFDLIIYINGLVSRSQIDQKDFTDIYNVYSGVLEQATELFILGYELGRTKSYSVIEESYK